jgi:2-dehydropantoate 2-reductase
LRIAIVGAGAIGCLFGVRLHNSGHDVLLIHHRNRTVASIRRRGVSLRELSGKTVRAHIEAKRSLSKKDDPDLVLLTVKAYDTETAARLLHKSIDDNDSVLSLQNGLGNIETLRRHLPANVLLAGTTTEAALQSRAGEVVHTGKGITWVGELKGGASKRCRLIKDVLWSAGFRAKASRNIEGVIWSKAIVNSAINPITALACVPNGELLRIPYLRVASIEIVNEGSAVARTLGVSLTPSPRSMLFQILASTGKNTSSMLQDIEAEKRTEIGQLNGWIASLGGRLGVSAPQNGLLTKLILGLEARQIRQ